MKTTDLQLHALLSRQLKRLSLSENNLPIQHEQWNTLLQCINRAYFDAEQDRYLLERSMELSSKELMELNKKLEEAQHIANLGYWSYEKSKDKFILAKETFHLIGMNIEDGYPSFQKFLTLVEETDRLKLQALNDIAFSEGKSYEIELRIKRKASEFGWYHIKVYPQKTENTYTLSGIIMDITERKKAEEEMKELHQQLMDAARTAGMADVATFVLHNIGNILNSVTVSIGVIKESMKKPYFSKLVSISEMIKENLSKQANYLSADSKGKLIPEYLLTLSKTLKKQHDELNQEMNNIDTHLEHIKDIVLMQKDISGKTKVAEKIYLPEIINSSLQMSNASIQEKDIEIIKNFSDAIFLMLDKSKLLQILVNLIRNAKDSLMLSKKNDAKKIIITARTIKEKSTVEIIVEDNGVGIAEEEIVRIFSFGFSTKKDGHGFGLHSSAIAAKELGGSLVAESAGINKGAVFTISLPLEPELTKKKVTDNARA